jgi:hypothetical protein
LDDWSPVGLTFIIVKASEGTTPDPMFSKHVAKARAAGLIVGAYCFNRDDVDMAAQVKTFAAASVGADLFVIDVEGTHAFDQAQTRDFMNRFRALTGERIGLYHSASGFFDAGQDWDWVAHWGVTEPSRPWDLHQYRGSPLDLDQYNGTAADMKAFVAAMNSGGTKVEAFTVPEESMQANIVTGTWLYDNSNLAASSGNIKIDPGRYLQYVGQFSSTPDIRIVAYESTTPDSNTTSKAMFVARAGISSFRKTPDLTPYDQADIDAATQPLNATIDAQSAIIAEQKTQAAALSAEIVTLENLVDQQDATIVELEVVVAEYDELKGALKKAVA